ncbi:MAG: SPOR domain-containing protein [Phocaeicola sp.]
MIDLAKQIESLLLENECVIVPDLGGFIAYSQPARYDEVADCFLPPARTIGFNPQLAMNDGLLVQSYMQLYQTDFPDATRIIQQEVNQLKDKLYQEGSFVLTNIGTLTYGMKQNYTFTPATSNILAPSLYGLPRLSLRKLTNTQSEKSLVKPFIVAKKKEKSSTKWIGRIAAAAVAIILFFSLSIPVENTYIENGNYAALGTSALFEAIRSQSLATAGINLASETEQQQKKETAIPANLKPVTTRTETVAPKQESKKEEAKGAKAAPVASTTQTANKTATNNQSAAKAVTTEAKKEAVATVKSSSTKKYHIIVASLSTAQEAAKTVESYQKRGFTGASSIEGGGRYRLSLASYDDMAQAYTEIKKLKEAGTCKDAWVFTAK